MRALPLLTAALLFALAPRAQAAQTPLQHARHVVAFFDRHRAAAATPAGQRALWPAIHSLAAATRALSSVFPPHHALWACIARYESGGDPHNPGNGSHFGYLAMSWGWLGYIQGSAADYSQAQQEWAAERAWAASGYSYAFLYGQWYEWDAADGCGTTG